MFSRPFSNFRVLACAMAVIGVFGALTAFSESGAPATPTPQVLPPIQIAQPTQPFIQPLNPLAGLKFDQTQKELSTKEDQTTADFTFFVTNASTAPITIDHVHTSCGCTVAKLPSQPWVMAPGESGKISATVNLAGKQGTFFKTIFVCATPADLPKLDLILKVNMFQSPQMNRMQNARMALANRQMVFKGDCAKCHVEPTVGLLDKHLYEKACGICHDANPRDSRVPDLHAFVHPGTYAYWKGIISEGKPNSMMPGFAMHNGGPLTDAQIDSLAKLCADVFPAPASPQSLKPAN